MSSNTDPWRVGPPEEEDANRRAEERMEKQGLEDPGNAVMVKPD